jgi:hypothetical protein
MIKRSRSGKQQPNKQAIREREFSVETLMAETMEWQGLRRLR